jgi:hypothetical protein
VIDRFLGLVIIGFKKVSELAEKTCGLAQFGNGKNNKYIVFNWRISDKTG